MVRKYIAFPKEVVFFFLASNNLRLNLNWGGEGGLAATAVSQKMQDIFLQHIYFLIVLTRI